ncbi:unnamed protein product [Paramecium primaurelia]|uniref:Uncharacterized protein n=1 Tax=Paramecium primaurelia TaxID=5886 RepID=A0A8S1K8C8_PARPR|nr:unnamed protein product [Paramecium primaurelia]
MQQQQTTNNFTTQNKLRESGNDKNKSIQEEAIQNFKQEDILKDVTNKLQFKILKKNEQLTQMKEEIIDLQVKWQEDKKDWLNEKSELERKCEFYKENLNAERQNNQKFQIQIDKLTSMLNQKMKGKLQYNENSALEKVSGQLNEEIDSLQKETGIMKTQICLLENKLILKDETISKQQKRIQKLKKKLDQQLQQQLEERMVDVDKQKKRSADIKERVSELELKLKNLSLESDRIKKDNKQLLQENDTFRIQKEKSSRLLPQLEDSNKRLEQEIQEYELQFEKMSKQIKELNNQCVNEQQQQTTINEEMKEKNLQIDNLQEQLNEQIRLFHIEQRSNTFLKEESEKYKFQLDRLTKQQQQLTDAQHKDLDNLEAKIEKISKELIKLREENTLLKSQVQNHKKEQGQYLDMIDQLQKQIRDLKGKNKILVQQHDDLDARINQLVQMKKQKCLKVRIQDTNQQKKFTRFEKSDSSSFSD